MPDKDGQARSMVGTWTKATTAACADKYPATLTFSTGTYRGMRGPEQGMVWWDAGIYRLEGENTLVVGTARSLPMARVMRPARAAGCACLRVRFKS